MSTKNSFTKRLPSWLKWPKLMNWRRRLRKEAEAAHNVEAAWLAVEKAVRKAAKNGMKHAVEELGVNVGAKGPNPKKRAKTKETGSNDESPLETAKVSCKR